MPPTPSPSPLPPAAPLAPPDAAPRSRARRILVALAQVALVAAAAGYMLHHGWDRWNDILVDFGRELYLSWQILQGKVLYRDLATFNGPLSPYVNALWFALFGVSLRTLILANLAVTAAITLLAYRVVRTVADRFAATCACLVFVLLCAFGQYGLYGNENYLAPYSHEMTHGLALNLAAVLCLHRFLQAGRRRDLWLAGAGLLVGLAALTKVEMLVAAAGSAAGALLLHAWAQRPPPGALARRAAVLLAGALVPPLIAVAVFAAFMPASLALLNVLGSSRHAFNTQLRTNLYFQTVSGMDHPLRSLAQAAAPALGISLALAAATLLAWRVRGGAWRHAAAALLAAAIAALALGAAYGVIPWPELTRSLALWMPLFLLAGAVAAVRARARDQLTPADLMRILLPAFAWLMLLKMILRVQLNHYGFVLAMPALILFVAAVAGWLPAWVARRGGSPAVVRAVALVGLGFMAGFHVRLSNHNHAACNTPVGRGPDRFFAPPHLAAPVNTLLDRLGSLAPPGSTLAVMPEGVMINYLLRLENPTPYAFFTPADVWMFGEQNILAAYSAKPPDFLVLVHKDTSQFGLPFFGVHYGQGMRAWTSLHYRRLGSIGAEPFTGPDFGIVVMKRASAR